MNIERGVKNFSLEVARGNMPGIATVHQTGRNTEIDSGVDADVWDNGQTGGTLIWVAPTTARTHDIVSASTSDDGSPAGVGARTVTVEGLTSWTAAEVSETVTMNGTTNVATSNAYVTINHMHVVTKGATNVNVGAITATAQTDGTVTAQINVGVGATEMAIYGIPSTQTLYLVSLDGAQLKAGGSGVVDVALLVNSESDAELTNFVHEHNLGLQGAGTSSISYNFEIPLIIPGPAIVKLHAHSGTNNVDLIAGFDGFLVDN